MSLLLKSVTNNRWMATIFAVFACLTFQFGWLKTSHCGNLRNWRCSQFNFFLQSELYELIESICYNFKSQLSKLLQSLKKSLLSIHRIAKLHSIFQIDCYSDNKTFCNEQYSNSYNYKCHSLLERGIIYSCKKFCSRCPVACTLKVLRL